MNRMNDGPGYAAIDAKGLEINNVISELSQYGGKRKRKRKRKRRRKGRKSKRRSSKGGKRRKGRVTRRK